MAVEIPQNKEIIGGREYRIGKEVDSTIFRRGANRRGIIA